MRLKVCVLFNISNISLLIIKAVVFLVWLLTPISAFAEDHQVVEKVRIAPTSFNPKESRQLFFVRTYKTGSLYIDVLDNKNNTLFRAKSNIPLEQGNNTIEWNGRASNGSLIPEGNYKLRFVTEVEVQDAPFTVFYRKKPTIQYSSVWPRHFTPNGTSPRRTQGLYFAIADSGLVKIQVFRRKKAVRTLFKKKMLKGTVHEYWWDGKDDSGQILPSGSYRIKIKAINARGQSIKNLYIKIHKTNRWQNDADLILKRLKNLFENKNITRLEYRKYRSITIRTKTLISQLSKTGHLQEWLDLEYVLHQVARQKDKMNNLHYFLFKIFLEKNLDYFSSNKSPAGWTEFKQLDDTFAFVYFKNRGLQPHPVATTIKVNAIHDDNQFILALDKLLKATYRRRSATTGRSFDTLLYQMEFQGGKTLWPSAMSQGKLLVALGRAAKIKQDSSYSYRAKLVINSFLVPHGEGGVLDARKTGNWYLLYAFTNKYVVLNGHIVALQEIKKFADLSGDETAKSLFDKGIEELVATVHKYDLKSPTMDWWSKYSLVSFPANSNYHLFNLSLLKWSSENITNTSQRTILNFYSRSWELAHIKAASNRSATFTKSSGKSTLAEPEAGSYKDDYLRLQYQP